MAGPSPKRPFADRRSHPEETKPMSMQTVENGNMELQNAAGQDAELRELLRVFVAVRDGDFSVRLPGHWTGLVGKIADAVNDVVGANQKMAEQLERVGQVVGQ